MSPSVSHCERTLPFRTNDPVTALPRWSEGATRPSRFLKNRMHSWGFVPLNLHHPLGASCGIVPSFTLSLYCWFGTVYISWAACHATCPGSRGLVQNAHYHPPTSSSFDVLHNGFEGVWTRLLCHSANLDWQPVALFYPTKVPRPFPFRQYLTPAQPNYVMQK